MVYFSEFHDLSLHSFFNNNTSTYNTIIIIILRCPSTNGYTRCYIRLGGKQSSPRTERPKGVLFLAYVTRVVFYNNLSFYYIFYCHTICKDVVVTSIRSLTLGIYFNVYKRYSSTFSRNGI